MPMDNQQPPMMNNGMGMPMDNVDNQPADEENPYNTNFDAGVEADEATDPKKYIQQLTGKLSQSLRAYNENLPQPDADLDKYVAGMIVKQAIEGLSPEDTNDILDKIKNGETPSEDESGTEPVNEPNATAPEMGGQTDGSMPMQGMGESTKRPNKQKIDEIFNQVMNNNDDDEMQQEPITNIGYRKKPFTSPKFK